MSEIRQMREVGNLLDLDCFDNSCRFKARDRGGPRTNGGCQCDLAAAVRTLRVELEAARGKLNKLGDTFFLASACMDELRAARKVVDAVEARADVHTHAEVIAALDAYRAACGEGE